MGSIRNSILAIPLLAVAVMAQGGPPPDGPGPHGGFGRGEFMGPPITGAPFSATRTETHQQTLADGNTVQQTHTEKIYRDADGRTRTEASMTTPSGTKTMITIADPVAGFVAHLNPTDSTALKMTLPTPPTGSSSAAPPPPPANSNHPQPVKADLGTQTIAGLAATGTSYTVTIPAGTVGNAQAITETRQVWISTALKIPVQVTVTDPLRGNSTMLLSDVTPGTQDATLFQIPSTYTLKTAPAHGGPGPGGPGPGGPGPGGPPPPPDGGAM